ncbi:50S ribosomal protein L23 [Buchnera aphidicola (Thelaxes californica)]|uniref:Large ribosomal subunit protein uL23 n=1 Tax=Buchnera aphidicola (Thelaxes californica) TaxID=1315998 RepID=A0A4D6YP62_9GAMM|nr:50S ribosomal protein L23 [Buchnera aphidicola]QCI26925.1 50S ribosomal protein L23 [Buchnera aphidicola (Thelaxes californica)]
MILKSRLLKILYAPKVSEKSSIFLEKTNTIILKVLKDANKIEIKEAVQKILFVKVKSVNTLVVKGKRKKHKGKLSALKKWKKAFVTLQKGQKLDLISGKQ